MWYRHKRYWKILQFPTSWDQTHNNIFYKWNMLTALVKLINMYFQKPPSQSLKTNLPIPTHLIKYNILQSWALVDIFPGLFFRILNPTLSIFHSCVIWYFPWPRKISKSNMDHQIEWLWPTNVPPLEYCYTNQPWYWTLFGSRNIKIWNISFHYHLFYLKPNTLKFTTYVSYDFVPDLFLTRTQ